MIGALVFLLNFSLKRFSGSPLNNISVKMIQNQPVSFIDEQDVKEIIYQLTPSKKMGDLDISNIERKLSENPVIDSVNVYLKLNGELNLHIVQRIPIFRLSKKGQSFYVDEKGIEFPVSRNYAYPCMLVSGNVEKEEYPMLVELVKKIERDPFSKNFFVGINKIKRDYFLVTNQGDYKVELGDLENIDFKINGFKTFVEKFLIYQDPKKYSKISVKYDNQIVTTLKGENEEKNSPKEEIIKPKEEERKPEEKRVEEKKPEEKPAEIKPKKEEKSKKEEEKPKKEKTKEDKKQVEAKKEKELKKKEEPKPKKEKEPKKDKK